MSSLRTVASVHLSPGRPILHGVTLMGPPPVGRVHIATENDVVALYGQNGAGKTRVLRALSAALRGIALGDSRAMLHVTVLDPEEEWDERFRQHLTDRARLHFREERGRTLGALADLRDQVVAEGLDAEYAAEAERALAVFSAEVEGEEFSPWTLSELVRAHLFEREMAHNVELPEFEWVHENIGKLGRLVLMPSGTASSPEWTVYAAVANGDKFLGDALDHSRTWWGRIAEELEAFRRLGDPDAEIPDSLRTLFSERHTFPWEIYGDNTVPVVEGILPGETLPPPSLADNVDWPGWATIPFVEIAVVNEPFLLVVDDQERPDPDLLMRTAIGDLGDVVAMYDEQVSLLSSEVEDLVSKTGSTATEIFQRFMPRALPLRFLVGDPNDWLRGELPHWQAQINDAEWLPLAELSNAQQRWATVACVLALSLQSIEPVSIAFLCDEPEAGLHRGAESALPNALAAVAAQYGAKVITATHSPTMLDAARVEPLHVMRGPSGRVVTHRLTVDVRTVLQRDISRLDLGLTPPDLLQLVRVIAIVEGKHDEAVFTEMLGDHLSAGILFVPVGGAKQLPSLASAHLLWNFTDADVVVILDGLAREKVEPIWSRCLAAYERNNRKEAQAVLRDLDRLPGGEALWIRDLLTKAVEQRQAHRIHVFPLAQPDVICYLPCPVPGQSWQQILAAWRSSARQAADIKGFIKERYGVMPNIRSIREAARSAPSHPELDSLRARLNEIAAFRSGETSPSNHPA